MIQPRQLGSSSVKITPIIFGAWAIGGWMWGGNDDNQAIEAIQASIANGVTSIDTAAIYGMGHSEVLVGKAIAGQRDKVMIATKCGMRWDSEQGSDPWPQKDNDGRDVIIRKNSRPQSIAFECEQSLKRLGVEVIDLFQIHWPDSSTPIEDSIGALEKLRQAGKIRAFGVSNYNVDELKRAQAVGPLASDQPPYSVIQRKIEKDLLPFCRENNIGVICYSPLERGLLTGSVGPERQFPPGDHRAAHKFFTVENRKRVQAALASIKPIADAHKASFAQTMIAWTISQPGITAAIVGARNPQQAQHNAGALNIALTDEEANQIRKAFDETSRVMMGS
jgi:aryl-alcohol dehydrogenase-like predicted oxidoreductase